MSTIETEQYEMTEDKEQMMINGNLFAVFVNIDGEEEYIGRVIAYSPKEAVEKAQQLPEYDYINSERHVYDEHEEFIVMSIGRISVHRV